MIGPNDPGAEEMGLTEQDKETPEQRVERLKEFRQLAEPMLDQYYQEGKTPFNIPREEALECVSGRIFERVEEAGLTIDNNYLGRVAELIGAINEATGQHYTLSKSALQVVEYHLQVAAGVEPTVNIQDVAFLAGEMNKGLKKSTGVGLAEWAVEYQKVHGGEIRDVETNEKLIRVFDQDISSHTLSQSNLTRIFAEYARSEGIDQLDPQAALTLLHERRFVVPEEWKGEFAENEDGREFLEAIDNAKRKIQIEEIITTLEGGYEGLSSEDRENSPITVSDVLAIASFGGEVPENWLACDDQTKKTIKSAMAELADNLGGRLGTSKGEPVVKFKK